MGLPRILVGTPIYEGKEYCREQFVENLKKFSYGNFHWLLVDNSKKPSYFHKLRRLYPGHVVRVPRGTNSRDALANSVNFLRNYALNNGYDYFFSLESDIFPPSDVIERLLRHNLPVVGGIYHIGNTRGRTLCLFKVVKKPYMEMMGTQLIGPEEQEAYFQKGLKQVHGMGVGCTLIRRDIVERYPFWYSSADDDRMSGEEHRKHPDVYFYLDLHNDKIPVFADTDIYCHHEFSDWTKVKDI